MPFAPNPNWSRFFGPGPEIYRYLRDTAANLGRDEHLSPDPEVVQQRWDSEAAAWHLAVKGGPSCRHVSSSNPSAATSTPKTSPAIPGLDDFTGTIEVTVTQGAFDRWNDRMRRQGRAVHLYLTACNPGLSTYLVNSQNDTVYHRPQTITASRRFSRRSPLTAYKFRPVESSSCEHRSAPRRRRTLRTG